MWGYVACQWCAVLNFLGKFANAFQIVDDKLRQSAQYQGLQANHQCLAGMSWLGKAHRGDEVMLGCIPCHAVKGSRLTGAFATYGIGACRA